MKDLSGDGKITKKDVLIGRGVIKAKKGKKIPLKKLNKAAKAPGKLGQRARFAKTLSKLRKK